MIQLLAVVVVSAASVAAQAVPVCMAVTADEAQSLLGPSAKRGKDPSGCDWSDGNKQLSVVRIGVASMFERARAGSAAKGSVQVEAGLGGTAFSAVPTAQHGGRAAIYVLKGDAVLVLDISGFAPGGAEERLPQMREVARKLFTKI